ncbi:hypothetical protein J6590_020103 [Homalodisca vitripennis]|nr:hypothetical protein J6590_020103 [Homalodisca vitripennis]
MSELHPDAVVNKTSSINPRRQRHNATLAITKLTWSRRDQLTLVGELPYSELCTVFVVILSLQTSSINPRRQRHNATLAITKLIWSRRDQLTLQSVSCHTPSYVLCLSSFCHYRLRVLILEGNDTTPPWRLPS